MPRPQTKSDAEVMAAIARAISKVGPAALTLADVASEAGVSAPALVQRFGSRRELLLKFAEQGVKGLTKAFAAARAETASPLEALQHALTKLSRTVRSKSALANHLGFLQMDLADSAFRVHAVAHSRAFQEEIASLLTEAVEAGELPVRADTERLTRAVYAMYNGALLTWALDGEGPVDKWVSELVDYILADAA